jgi:aspartate 1-decarboxylase
MHPGDLVIIATFADVEDAEVRSWKPRVVLVDEHNRVRAAGVNEVPGPKRRD